MAFKLGTVSIQIVLLYQKCDVTLATVLNTGASSSVSPSSLADETQSKVRSVYGTVDMVLNTNVC